METKSLQPGTRHGNKVYCAPVTVSGRHIEIGTFTGDKAHAGRNEKTLKLDWALLAMNPNASSPRPPPLDRPVPVARGAGHRQAMTISLI